MTKQTSLLAVSHRPEEIIPDAKTLASMAESNDVAIITIGRVSGEGNDRLIENFSLTQSENELIVILITGNVSRSLSGDVLVFVASVVVENVIIFTQVLVKTLYEVMILPVTAWVVKRIKAYEGIDNYDDNISYNPFRL